MVGPILKTQVATSSDYDILVSLSSFFFYQESTVVIRVSLVQCSTENDDEPYDQFA